jgi:hypothetical protein
VYHSLKNLEGKSSSFQGPSFVFIEAIFRKYPRNIIVDEKLRKNGILITWKPEKLKDGCINAFSVDRREDLIQWDDIDNDPGWYKLDWVVADAALGKVAKASICWR